jgi:ABC-type bacteriocin/lantibiotic exporter with double-glycine peptidase domain
VHKLIYQQDEWDCGPTSLVNALALRGRATEWSSAVRWVGATSEKGTSAAGMMRALDWLRIGYTQFSSADKRRSWRRLTRTNRPVILPVDLDEHWVILVSGVGHRVVVWDPNPTVGLMVYGCAEFCRRWLSPTKKFYGIFLT